MTEPLLYETHSHTTLCGHAFGKPEEYAEVALSRNLRGYTITCHNPMPDGFGERVRMSQAEFPAYLQLVAQTREKYEGQLDVLLGLECDYFPGYERFLEQQIGSAEFHYILGSVHPQQMEFRERFATESPQEFQQLYFDQLAQAAETGLFDTLSHPDLVKNMTWRDWDRERIWPDILRCLDRVAETDVAIELNTSGAKKTIPEMNPSTPMLAAACERGIPVVIGADAHRPHRVGDLFEEALRSLVAAGYEQVSYFRKRVRHEVPISRALASLRPPASKSADG